jgi:CDP-2,3-bis-(O-geranylgeranyl)-sn-glycerol synthase
MYKLAQLLYLMAPAYLANMAPPFLKYWKGWNRPISKRWLGEHKTVGGFALGVTVAIGAAYVQSAIDWEGSLVSYDNWPLIGLALGFGALGGDTLKSFFKRARGIPPGESWVPADQLDFVLGALIFAWPWARLDWSDVLIIVAVSFVGDIAVNQAAYRLKIRDTGW